jgi:hypothetical protein
MPRVFGEWLTVRANALGYNGVYGDATKWAGALNDAGIIDPITAAVVTQPPT